MARALLGTARVRDLLAAPMRRTDSLVEIGQAGLRRATAGLSTAARGPELTDRQREVAALVARGYTNEAIARALAVSINTVKKHVTTMLDVLGAANRAELATLADRTAARDAALD